MPGQREHEAHRQLGDADAVGAGRVHHHDAARAGGGHIDVVHAGARAGDRPKPRRRVDQRRRHFRGAADDDARRRRRGRRRAARVRGPMRASTSQPSARSRSRAEAGRSSATTIFTMDRAARAVGVGGTRRYRYARHEDAPSIIAGCRVDVRARVAQPALRTCDGRTTMVQTARSLRDHAPIGRGRCVFSTGFSTETVDNLRTLTLRDMP